MADNAVPNNIFVDLSGRPLQIFVETSEFASRPKLIRDLRRGGAVIAHYPTDAHIILVDIETEAGKQFVQDWGNEPGKAVLRWEWVRISTDAGRALLANDHWGGMCPMDASNGHGAIVDNEHPLPTPPPDIAAHPQSPTNPPYNTAALQALSQGRSIPSTPIAPQPSQPNSSQLPLGITIPHQVPPPVNGVSTYAQNSSINAEALTALAQLLQMRPGDVSTVLAQFNARGPQTLSASNLGPVYDSVAASDGPQVSSPGLDASDFMTPSSSSASTRVSQSALRRSPDTPSSIPSKRRKPVGASTLSSSRSKGKHRAYSQEPLLKQRRRSESPLDYDDSDDDTSLSHHEPSGSPRKPDEIFTHDNGEPVVFWVQMETKQRGDLLQMIKRNKGRVVAEILTADYAILAQNHPKSFEYWLKLATQGNKVVLQSRYIHECVKQSALLDTHDFAFAEVQKPRRGRPPSARTQATPTKKTNSPTKTKAPVSVDRSARASRSPPPPQQSERPGKWLFTADETNYFRYYVPVLIARDPTISLWAIGDKLHNKMPHHTIKSWRSWVCKEVNSKYVTQSRERVTRRARQENSTHDRAGEETAELPPPTDESAPGSVASPELPTNVLEVQNTSVAEPDDAHDFDFIVQFLANGGADNRSDDEVWALLAKEGPSRTAEEWQAFWVERGEDINTEVQHRMDAADASATQLT